MHKRNFSVTRWVKQVLRKICRPTSHNDLVQILRQAEKSQLIDIEALQMTEGVMQVSHLQVRDIMIPRAQMVTVEREKLPKEFLPVIIESGHSRFPVITESRNEVIGLLLAKDLLKHSMNGDWDAFNMKHVLRQPTFIPESKRLNILLKEFRLQRNHMAIVLDEYGGVSGLVTIEDVLEQIVGKIQDEYDENDEAFYIRKLTNHKYILNALTPIKQFNETFHKSFSEEAFDTIGGYVTHEVGHLPKRDEIITIDNLSFKILHADSRRIRLMRMKIAK